MGSSLGSGKPNDNCIFLMAARYDLIVWGDRPPSAINAEKQQSKCSVFGIGSGTWYCLQKEWNFFITELLDLVDGARPS